MNNLVKNNPTAIKVIKMHKIKQQRNDIIKSLSFICLFILICYITGISMKTETISAIPINHQLNNKIATIITDKVCVYKLREDCIPYAGMYISLRDEHQEYDLDFAKRILESENFMEYVKKMGINISGGSLRITSKDIENYRFYIEE